MMKAVLLLVITFCIVCVQPRFYDYLSPYEDGFHGSKRSAKDVLDCQHERWGNKTYDEYELSFPLSATADVSYKVLRFEDTLEKREDIFSIHRQRYLLGSIAFIDNPYYTFSVLEPSKPGGCEIKYLTASRSTVRQTTSNRIGGCELATNAGYFSVTSGQCLGNVVSDGRVVQVSEELNANFGIGVDGSIAIGYIPPQDVASGLFKQLVSGVIWLVRNGTNYVNESMKIECSSHQNTGKMSTFVDVLSARTAVGIDEQDRIVMAHIEGQTHKRGVNLHEFADLLINHGIKSAINLDGGGSATFIHKDVLINYPSDHCFDPAYRCERHVSTILCLHKVQCMHPTCHDHGTCHNGECTCSQPWLGRDCSKLNCSLEQCSGHGNCSDGLCVCEAGWEGSTCDKVCSPGYYGLACTSRCHCYGRSLCDRVTGTCKCPPGYLGFGCWRHCEDGYFGDNCTQRCNNCFNHGKCSFVDGICLCLTNWTGPTCNQSTEELNSSSVIAPNLEPSILVDVAVSRHINTSSSHHICNNQTADNKRIYHYLLFSFGVLLISSITIHVLVCIRLKYRTKVNSVDSMTTLATRRRRKRRRRTQVVQDSSSDCSI